MHLAMGGAAVSHRDLVSILPYSSVASAEEDDDKITARQDTRVPRPPVASGNERASSPDRQAAIRALVGCLDSWSPDDREQSLLADSDRSSPGSAVSWRDFLRSAWHLLSDT